MGGLVVAGLLTCAQMAWGAYSGTGTFTNITTLDHLTDGYYVMVASNDTVAMSSANAGTYFSNAVVSPSGGTLIDPAASCVWLITTNASGDCTLYSEVSSHYVTYAGSENTAYASDTVGSTGLWIFSYASNVFTCANKGVNIRSLQYNAGSPRFACYTTGQQKLLLYKMGDFSSAPTFTSDTACGATVGEELVFTVSAQGSPLPVLALESATATVGSYAFAPTTGQLSYTAPVHDVGTNTFIFTASNNLGVATQSLNVVVEVFVAPTGDTVAVSFGAVRIIGEEGGPALSIPVNLASSGTARVQIQFSGPTNGTARWGTDFNCSTTLVITSSSSSNLVLNIVNDVLAEGMESVRLTLVPIAPAIAGATTQAVFYLRDDDAFSVLAGNITSGSNQEYEDAGERILEALGPDVALLQEFNMTNGTSEAVYRAWVNEHFGTNFSFCLEPVATANIPNGIVSRWPISEWGEWDDTTLTDRDFVWAKIALPGNVPLYAVSLHIKASSGSDAQRTAEVRALTNYIAQAGWMTNGYVVLGGDFNFDGRSETALSVLTSSIVRDTFQSADQVGNKNTNSGRDKPYDMVLPSTNLNARHRSFACYGYNFPNGMVFDTRITWASGLPPPALSTDSAVFNMQHMAVMKLFEFEKDATSKGSQTLTFPSIASQVATNRLGLSATASSGLSVSFSVASGNATISGGTNLAFTGAGAVSIVASQVGDDQWNAAPPMTNTFSVVKASATVTLGALAQIYDDTPKSVTVTTVPVGLSVSVTYAGSSTAPSATGSYVVVATVMEAIYGGGTTGTLAIAESLTPFQLWLGERALDYQDNGFALDADQDGDGMTTWEEYLADTDPSAKNSFFMVTGHYVIFDQQIHLSFPASTNRFYRLESSNNLTNAVSVTVSNLGWGVLGMVVTNILHTDETWYGVIRSGLAAP